MELGFFLEALIPFWNSVTALVMYFGYLAVAGFVLPGKVVPGVILQDGSRLHYRCNGLLSLLLLVVLLGIGAKVDVISPTVISERGVELLSTTFAFSCLVLNLGDTGALCCWVQFKTPGFFPKTSHHRKPSTWLVLQTTHFRAGMMGWLFINLSILAKCILEDGLSHSMILCQVFCAIYILDYFLYEEYMTSTMAMVSTLGARWDIIAERLGFMLVFGDLVWIPFTFSIQGWWLLANKVELTAAAVIANCLVFLLGYVVFRGANKQKHVFKKNPKATIWGRPPKVIGGKLLASGYWGIARHCNYLGDFLLALSFSLPCGLSSPVPYFYPIYLLILLIWRERRDEARCAEKYKEMWAEYRRLVPWRKEPYLY